MLTPVTADDRPAAELKFGARYVGMISLVAAMGGLLFGYDWVVIGGAKPFFEPYFGIHDESVRGWANSCALLGCLLGAMTAGALSDRFGRKWLLSLSAVLFVITSLGNALATDFNVFILLADTGRRRDRAGLQLVAHVHRRRFRPPRCADAWFRSIN